jgi:hypothetical protein
MRSDVQRILNFEARMQSTLLDPTVTAMAPLAVANYTKYITEFYPYQLQLRTILLDEGVKSYLYAIYEAMNGQFYHLWRVSAGNPLVADFTAIQAKWTARGADATISKRIALDLWGVIIP